MAAVEVLIGDPPCPGCKQIAALADRGGKMITEIVRIMGLCQGAETLPL